jgi:flagellar biosynthesis protein FlhF
MNVKKFTAANSRDALRKVRELLGPDAVILSNRTVEGGVEILALANDDISSLAAPAVEKPALMHEVAAAPASAPGIASPAMPASAPFIQQRRYDHDYARNQDQNKDQASGLAEALNNARDITLAPDNTAKELKAVMSEIRSMRGMMESQLAEISWGTLQKREPHKAEVLREMLAAGFSASLSRYLTEKLPSVSDAEGGLNWIKSILARNLNTLTNENEILEKGGVFALVGPTGVGKTTTTAKLAARCVMRHGTGKLALITTDGYRIGGHEQLRIYGKILGVMVHSVRDEADLRIALKELKNKHTVLIDTVGVSQRDQMVAEQIAMLSGTDTEVKRLLCLNSTSTGETLNEVVRAYKGPGLAGCIMTKLDEAATIGSVLDLMIRQKLNLFYVSNGQRVPEDLHLANKLYLVDRAFKLKRETAPFQFQDDELPLVMAAAGNPMNDSSLRGVSLG